jgi:multidrug resistance protein, MATE family
MGEYFSIGIPSTIMLCLDWWVWELLILISGYLGVHEQATNIVIMNIILIAYMVTMGLE